MQLMKQVFAYHCKLMKKLLCIVLAIVSLMGTVAFAQMDVPTNGITVGLHSGNRGNALEAEYSYGSIVYWPKTNYIKGLGTISLGLETGPLSEQSISIAPKISYTMNWFISFGVSMLYYTDFNQGSLRFRPEVGISMLGIRVYHGWNFSVDKYNPMPMNTRFIAASYYIPF